MAKLNVYEIITEKIVEALENGTIPWRKPWNGLTPRNYVTNREYSGINYFLLSMSSYSSPYWLTFKQAKELGGSVKKGESSSIVTFWKMLENTKTGLDGKKESKTIPLLRYYRVFNLEQCENIREIKGRHEERPEFSAIEKAEKIINNMQNKPIIEHTGGNRACYSPILDIVKMPVKESFKENTSYYSVLFHEVGHSTGHETRLDRFSTSERSAIFGNEEYGKEELTAEMTSAFLCGVCGIDNSTIENSAAYIASWTKAIKNDSKMIVNAASRAQKAADYILNKIPAEKTEENKEVA